MNKENTKTSEQLLQERAFKILALVSYQISATINGKGWKSPTFNLEGTSERAFINYAQNTLFKHPRYNGAKNIKIVKYYTFNGKQLKEVIYKQ